MEVAPGWKSRPDGSRALCLHFPSITTSTGLAVAAISRDWNPFSPLRQTYRSMASHGRTITAPENGFLSP
jgi:hypothetical protein